MSQSIGSALTTLQLHDFTVFDFISTVHVNHRTTAYSFISFPAAQVCCPCTPNGFSLSYHVESGEADLWDSELAQRYPNAGKRASSENIRSQQAASSLWLTSSALWLRAINAYAMGRRRSPSSAIWSRRWFHGYKSSAGLPLVHQVTDAI
ncbi:hypothetical protein EJ06DRAFT_422083 [Trichodelitschia bisporula]|uniref:Uncharacterized protein n=1 Tax=Trichodelitschia bisporula TaxID=703511 RepID=A0A6G1HWC1_9PEZI|nr:hypothetical protein EJ06DRAFT_422083 [Trichodelitschia bisporula]